MTLSTSAVIRRGRPSPASLDLRSLLKWGHWNSQIGGAITKEYLFKGFISKEVKIRKYCWCHTYDSVTDPINVHGNLLRFHTVENRHKNIMWLFGCIASEIIVN